jgi:hypothetical protein
MKEYGKETDKENRYKEPLQRTVTKNRYKRCTPRTKEETRSQKRKLDISFSDPREQKCGVYLGTFCGV